jgi:hypothetical protein
MPVSFTTYELATGDFKAQYLVPNEAARDLNVPAGHGYIDGHQDVGGTYVDDTDVVERPEQTLTISDLDSLIVGELVTIAGIEPGSVLRVADYEGVVDDGFIEWTSAEEGTFQIMISRFPYKGVAVDATFTSV